MNAPNASPMPDYLITFYVVVVIVVVVVTAGFPVVVVHSNSGELLVYFHPLEVIGSYFVCTLDIVLSKSLA